jgi:hypothetical protein
MYMDAHLAVSPQYFISYMYLDYEISDNLGPPPKKQAMKFVWNCDLSYICNGNESYYPRPRFLSLEFAHPPQCIIYTCCSWWILPKVVSWWQ